MADISNRSLALILTLTALSACTVYKSTDRDYFNANAVAGAPAARAVSVKPLSSVCQNIQAGLSSQFGLDLSSRSEDARLENLEVAIAKRSPRLPETAAVCIFTYAPQDADRDLVETSRHWLEKWAPN